ncbi:DUF6642 family protein [Formosa algae]|uniref:DUF6642 family protein n=1 Tax=Formosa algae TaxID=225843 RepID=UPI000CCE9B42|nr:DUF6642 family protein [Formosa algae]PNW25864.1 hypothetical protein BKP44_18835 [Formosa algae]
MLEQQPKHSPNTVTDSEYFIYCLEGVPDIDTDTVTKAQESLEHLVQKFGIASIYKTCDTIEGLEESLNSLVLDDHHFTDYEIIYLVMSGANNTICLNDYHYSLQEVAEIFEGRLQGKILHFSNAKILDLDEEDAQYFLDITGARGVSGYGNFYYGIDSLNLDQVFFNLFNEDDDMLEVVEELHQKHYALCKLLDFRLYY